MDNQKRGVATFSKGIYRNKKISLFLQSKELLLRPTKNQNIDLVVGWGKKPNTQAAIAFADKFELPYCALEDGFIHSMGQGVLGSESCSLVVDSQGIYYDATQASDLETLISRVDSSVEDTPPLLHSSLPATDIARAQSAIQRIINSNISKYNNASLQLADSIFNADEIVLVIDQTAGDMSLKYGYVNEKTFDEMLQAALDEYPNAQIIVKTHPDVIVGKKKGSINLSKLSSRVHVISESINPIVLLKKVDAVYVATSQMGFEALMLGKKVVCFGAPFYAGWGLTDDRADSTLAVWARRGQKRSLEEIFSAAYIHYTRYLHPDTQQRCELEDIISYFELQYKNKLENQVFCINFTRWKQSHIKAFLGFASSNKGNIVFVSSANQAIKKGFNSSSQLITWASKNQAEVDKLMQKWGGAAWQVEDGFIRSTGLGTDLTAPASLVLDKTGVYYDPSKPSDLETLLQNKVFSKEELERAEDLKNSLLENELSKYNLGGTFNKSSINVQKNQKIILVSGQVEGDASIKKGCVDIASNTALVKAVRENNPEAYIIYKPHPDVVSGNRKGKVAPDVIQKHTDLELLDASITDCLAVVDEVHTMTSLVGFEGLMRGLKVVCYGLPFYSSWGLTEDRHPLKRRTRKLTLNELVAGTLIDYPRYINWQTGQFTTPEIIVEQLKKQIDEQGGKQSNQVFWLTRLLRKTANFSRGFLKG